MSEPMNANFEGSNPKLQQVKYINILPEGKISNYTQNNRIDFKPDSATAAYFDGKQSYLNIEVTNTSTFNNGNGNAATAAPPMCFPAHVGANAVINRLLIRSEQNGQVIEDLEGYNQIHGIKNGYTHDTDVFKTLGRISGVVGRTCEPMNQLINNPALNYFLPNGQVQADDTIDGGSTATSAQFCLPIESGLFSAYAGEHHVVPNLDVPLHLQFFLEKNNVALQVMSSLFYVNATIGGVNCVDAYGRNPLDNHPATKAGTAILLDTGVCDTTLSYNGEAWDASKCAFRVGQCVTDGTDTRVITEVKSNQGAGNNQLQITVDVAFTAGDGAIQIAMASINRSYEINKVELKLLVTIPDDPTMRMIRSAVARGISFTSVQLYKISTAAQLKNSVLDIPESLTMCKSILSLPCNQSNLEALDNDNSYIYCKADSNNNTKYQWQIQNTLIPNLAVDTNYATNAKSDNAIYFGQASQALRHFIKVQALGDSPAVDKTTDRDLGLVFFYPISLSPMNRSFNLIDSAPQLRIENNAAVVANIPAQLFHNYVVHTRILKSSEMGCEVQF